MAQIAKNPKYDQAASNLKARLEGRIDADRETAVAVLDQLRATLSALVEDRKFPDGSGIVDEVATLSKLIESVDSRCIDDKAIALLQVIQVRLSRLALLVNELITPPAPKSGATRH